MTSVCNGMLLKFFLNKFSFLSFIAILKIGILNFFRQNLIAVFRNMEIFESLCFNTWRFKSLHGLNTEIFESPYFNTRRLKNLHEIETWRFC